MESMLQSVQSLMFHCLVNEWYSCDMVFDCLTKDCLSSNEIQCQICKEPVLISRERQVCRFHTPEFIVCPKLSCVKQIVDNVVPQMVIDLQQDDYVDYLRRIDESMHLLDSDSDDNDMEG